MKTADVPPTATTEETIPLVFQWERRQRVHWRLAILVALSVLVHAVGFYLFQAAYTPTGSQASPSVQVTVLPLERSDASPESRAEARALAHWLAVADPSLSTEPAPHASDRRPGELVDYVPSYRAAPPPFKPLDPPVAGSAPPPRPRPPGPVPTVYGNSPAVRSAGPAAPTRVTLSGGVASLVPYGMPPVNFVLPAGVKPLAPTVFLVGVRPEGGAPFLFREESSGEVAADDFAQGYLARLGFQTPASGDGNVVWGRAEFHWGRDVYR